MKQWPAHLQQTDPHSGGKSNYITQLNLQVVALHSPRPDQVAPKVSDRLRPKTKGSLQWDWLTTTNFTMQIRGRSFNF